MKQEQIEDCGALKSALVQLVQKGGLKEFIAHTEKVRALTEYVETDIINVAHASVEFMPKIMSNTVRREKHAVLKRFGMKYEVNTDFL
jgi:hypothetical protein